MSPIGFTEGPDRTERQRVNPLLMLSSQALGIGAPVPKFKSQIFTPQLLPLHILSSQSQALPHVNTSEDPSSLACTWQVRGLPGSITMTHNEFS